MEAILEKSGSNQEDLKNLLAAQFRAQAASLSDKLEAIDTRQEDELVDAICNTDQHTINRFFEDAIDVFQEVSDVLGKMKPLFAFIQRTNLLTTERELIDNLRIEAEALWEIVLQEATENDLMNFTERLEKFDFS